jgi:hypothetical protein
MICFKRPKAAPRRRPSLDAARRQRHRSHGLLGVEAMVSVRQTKQCFETRYAWTNSDKVILIDPRDHPRAFEI